MRVYLTFDIEVWCDGWQDLDRMFAGSFMRYVYGRSAQGDYALPETLAILNRHGLGGVFFVEPLFAARAGTQYLETIVALIRDAGHEIQLHLHPEWTDEAREPLIVNCQTKRQHLTYYTLDEQTALIGHGKAMLEAAGSGPITAFRSGSFAANRDTFEALRRNGIYLDTSLNRCHAISGPDLRGEFALDGVFSIGDITTCPVTVFTDGFGRDRAAQVGACSFSELRDALCSAANAGLPDFVVVSHNFEMLKGATSDPDWIVVRRFDRLCAFLAAAPQQFQVCGFAAAAFTPVDPGQAVAKPCASWSSTSQRYLEQIRRRL